MSKVIVTGANGQLGQCLQNISSNYPEFRFLFLSKEELNITDKSEVNNIVTKYEPNFIINAAAYTLVDKAEEEHEKAYSINVTGVSNLLNACEKQNVNLVQISTDYVFDGKDEKPKLEHDICNPINYYGKTKFEAEKLVSQSSVKSIIIRTSWLYSRHGSNFLKTILRLKDENSEIKVVNDQVGSPTHCYDLAEAILWFLSNFPEKKEIFHFANRGSCSWFEFASKILTLTFTKCKIKPIPSSCYPTLAKRPSFSVLDTKKFRDYRGMEIKSWDFALEECLKSIK